MVLSKDKKKAKEGDTAKALPAIISYQSWYSRSLPVVKQLIPERYQEFQEQYKLEKRKGKEAMQEIKELKPKLEKAEVHLKKKVE